MIRVPRALPALLLACLAALPAMAQPAPAPPQGSTEQQKTIADIRSVGTAMFNWYRDQRQAQPAREKKAHPVKANPASVDLAEIPVISWGDLAKILIPKYIREIPDRDGWGNP